MEQHSVYLLIILGSVCGAIATALTWPDRTMPRYSVGIVSSFTGTGIVCLLHHWMAFESLTSLGAGFVGGYLGLPVMNGLRKVVFNFQDDPIGTVDRIRHIKDTESKKAGSTDGSSK